jgi:hypothetical protein
MNLIISLIKLPFNKSLFIKMDLKYQFYDIIHLKLSDNYELISNVSLTVEGKEFFK